MRVSSTASTSPRAALGWVIGRCRARRRTARRGRRAPGVRRQRRGAPGSPMSGVNTVRSMGSSTCSIPPSQTSCWSTDTLSSTTTRRNAGSRQASRKADRPARTAAHGSAFGEGGGHDARHRVGLYRLVDGSEQGVLAAEVVVEGSSSHARPLDDVLDRGRRVAPFGEPLAGDGDQEVTGLLRLPGPQRLDIHAPSLQTDTRSVTDSRSVTDERSVRRRVMIQAPDARGARLPVAVHESRPWRIRELTPDFTVEDVWALPVGGGAEDFPTLLALMAGLDPAELGRPVRLVPCGGARSARSLVGPRADLDLGRARWSRPGQPTADPGTNETSLIDRLPDDLRGYRRIGFRRTPFCPSIAPTSSSPRNCRTGRCTA